MTKNEILKMIDDSDLSRKDLTEIINASQKKIRNKDTSDEPYAGLLSFNRVFGSGIRLFGSDIEHDTIIEMKLNKADCQRQYYENQYYSKDMIAKVYMSYNQFTQAITSFGLGCGVPVTIRYTEAEGDIPLPAIPEETEIISDEFRQHLDKCRKIAEDARNKTEEIVTKKTLNKSDREELINLMDNLIREVSSNTEFTMKQFNEYIHRKTTDLESEIESFAQHKLQTIALESLHTGSDKNRPALTEKTDNERKTS